jgi:integrase
VLDEWVKQNIDTWAPSSARDHQSRVRSLKKDQIARLPLARLTVADVAVMTTAASIDPAAELALRIAAVAGARRAELASLRWTDEQDGHLLIDSAIEITKRAAARPSCASRRRRRPTYAP